MKQVIFICLLSVSMCLSDTAAPVGNPSVVPPPEKHDVAVNTDKQTTAPPTSSVTPNKVTTAPAANDTNTVPKDPTSPPPKNETSTPSTEKPTPAPIPVVPTNSSVTPSNQTTPASTNSTTTSPPDHKTSSTVTPKTIVPTPTVQARGFDGASFVGGIILTLGLLAIGFMGFKYYKNQTERNYHTL